MRPRHCLAISAVLASGCATPGRQPAARPEPPPAIVTDLGMRDGGIIPAAGGSRGGATLAVHPPAPRPSGADRAPSDGVVASPPKTGASAIPVALTKPEPSPIAPGPEVVLAELPPVLPAGVTEPGVTAAKIVDEPAPAGIAEAVVVALPTTSTGPEPAGGPATPGPAAAGEPAGRPSLGMIPADRPAASPSIAESRPEAAPKSKGRPVASVGDEVIALPELTAAVKARLAELGPGAAPSRRQVIALARSVLKSMIVRSLILQEARDTLGGAGRVEEAEARIGRAWADEELPALLRREGVGDEAGLRAKLARGLATPESLREEFIIRSLATEMMRRDRSGGDLDAYLDGLRRRRAIRSIMSPAELAAAGRHAATTGEEGL